MAQIFKVTKGVKLKVGSSYQPWNEHLSPIFLRVYPEILCAVVSIYARA